MNTITHEDHAERIERIGPTILLSSGRYFDFTNPTPLTEQEVAHALAHLCRFTGHCREFYSVAQHSIIVSMLLPPPMKLWGLLHDAVEAVVGDMSGPLKRLFPEYKALEDRCERVILAGFGLDVDSKPPEVKRADLVALRTEQRDLMHAHGHVWTCLDGIAPVGPPGFITSWTPEQARTRFLLMYRDLVAGKPMHSVVELAA
jgi:hypothetical protein